MSIHEQDLFTGKNKVETAIERIRQFCKGKKVLVAFSGGKDSQCCYHLAKDAGIEFDAQYSITRFEPPELIQFIRKNYPDVKFRRAYKMSLVDEIELRGLPSRWSRWCCGAKHKKTEGYDIAIIGIRWQESARRKKRWSMFGQKQDRTFYVCPICDWSEQEVWEYLNEKGVPHCCLYDEGYKRIGCVCCPLTANMRDEEIKRYPKIVRALRIGYMKYISRTDFKSDKTLNITAQCRQDPDKYFNMWLKYGATGGLEESKELDEPCLFAGTGFSESDAGENNEIGDKE